MIPFDRLESSLLDLLYELRDTDLRLILGGGYGLYVKRQYIVKKGVRTIIDREDFPEERSTRDLDIFLRIEILSDSNRARLFAGVLQSVGYKVVEAARYYQFEKAGIKIDLLTGPENLFDRSQVRIEQGTSGRRIKPKERGIGLHAHSTNEAISIYEHLLEIPLSGFRNTGEEYQTSISLLHPFTYVLMKLFAFRDKEGRKETDNASKHAMDVYLIVAMMTEEEYKIAGQFSTTYREEPHFLKASQIVREYFSETERLGILRIREHPLFSSKMNLRECIAVLMELFSREE